MKTIRERKVCWTMSGLNINELEIQKWIEKLDDVAKSYEAIWGFERLPRLVDPGLAAKWQSQVTKLNVAIDTSNLVDMQILGAGLIRAWDVLDKAARNNGHTPNDVDVWSVTHPDSGNEYRIVKNNADARGVPDSEAVVYTLEEVVRILDKHSMINVVKKHFPGTKVEEVKKENINWDDGDFIPF